MTLRKKGAKDDSAGSLTESDFAQDKMGSNKLQGDDQELVRNQRHAVPDEKTETDDVVESLEKLDKDVRARTDLAQDARGLTPPAGDRLALTAP